MRWPRGGRRPRSRGRPRRGRGHPYSFQPPRNVIEPVPPNTSSNSSCEGLEIAPHYDGSSILPPNTLSQPSTDPSNDTAHPPAAAENMASPKPLVIATTNASEVTAIPSRASVSDSISSADGATNKAGFSPTEQYLYGQEAEGGGAGHSPTDKYLYGLDGEKSGVEESGSTGTLLGKRKEHPQSAKEESEGVSGDEVVTDKEASDRNKSPPAVEGGASEDGPVSQGEMMQVNKRTIDVVGTITDEQFLCNLCLAQLNSRRNLQRHIMANEHMRRVACVVKEDEDKAPYFCKVCYVKCSTEDIYSRHMEGKKHLKSVLLQEKLSSVECRPVGPLLEQLLRDEVEEEGDGLSLGLSPSMIRFFSLPGPFIGLQYAEEIGTRSEANPKYTCTLCNTMTDAGNHYLHFTSTSHRMNVLRKDYPDKFRSMRGLMSSSERRSDATAKLKDIVSEIQAKEGRKVELIKRKILKEPPIKQKPSGSAPVPPSEGQPSFAKRGRGLLSFPRGRGTSSSRGCGWNKASTFTPPPQRGGHQERGRGRGGRRGHTPRGRGAQGTFQPPTNNYYDFSKPSGASRYSSPGAPSGRYQGPTTTQQQPYGQRPSAPANKPPPFHPVKPLVFPAPPFKNEAPPSSPFLPSSLSSPPASQGQWPPSTPPLPQPATPTMTPPSYPPTPLAADPNGMFPRMVAPPTGTERAAGYPGAGPQQFGGGGQVAGSESQFLQKLANAQIENEEDAEKALQLSSTLTQALLAYRIKEVSSSNNPISSLLNTLNAMKATKQ